MLKIIDHAIYRGPNPWAMTPLVVCTIKSEGTADTDLLSQANRAAEWALSTLNEGRGDLHEAGASDLGNGTAAFWVEFHHPRVTLEAMTLAVAAINNEAGIEQQVKQLQLKCRRHHPDYQARILMQAARANGIPVLPLTPGSNIWQYGWGMHAELFFESASNHDGYLAKEISASKAITKTVFQALGVPTPRYVLIHKEEDLPKAAQAVGWPCVVKPLDRGGGKGVTADIHTEAGLANAFATARQYTTGPIMVEAHAYGDDYRLMVFGGKLVAAIRREPPAVIGDGQSNIADLMLKFNQRRSQNMVASNYLRPVHLDQTVLAHLTGQGLSVESVPPPGNRVTLRSNANLSTGGTCTDVTADTHPDVRAMAEAFGMTLGFGALGLDYITTDISRPFASGDSFIEANTTPGLDAAIAAGISAETIGTTLLGSSSRRIPAVLLLIADDTFFEVLATFKAEMLNHPGMAWLCGEEAGIAGLPLNVAHQPVWQRIPVLLKNRSAAALIAVWSLSDLIKHGAPLDRFDIVLNGGELTIPAQWQTVLARLSSRPVRVATKDSIMKEALMAVAAAGESHCDDAMNRSR